MRFLFHYLRQTFGSLLFLERIIGVFHKSFQNALDIDPYRAFANPFLSKTTETPNRCHVDFFFRQAAYATSLIAAFYLYHLIHGVIL
jgi:hypothetical protein